MNNVGRPLVNGSTLKTSPAAWKCLDLNASAKFGLKESSAGSGEEARNSIHNPQRVLALRVSNAVGF